MANDTQMDFTKMRKGKRCGSRKIDVCPVCGLKGLIGPKTVVHSANGKINALLVKTYCYLGK